MTDLHDSMRFNASVGADCVKKISTIRYAIKATDKSGGSGAKCIVKWKSKMFLNAPLIEAIMISIQSG